MVVAMDNRFWIFEHARRPAVAGTMLGLIPLTRDLTGSRIG
jgi:hypothetical protein